MAPGPGQSAPTISELVGNGQQEKGASDIRLEAAEHVRWELSMAVLKKHDTSWVLKSAAPMDFVLRADHTIISFGVATKLKRKRDT